LAPDESLFDESALDESDESDEPAEPDDAADDLSRLSVR
jgi:hypothetical protein